MYTALTIAGSDSGGGAGIQADLKTFAALGVYGLSALTAVTAQDTCGVRDIHPLPAAFVALQIDTVLEDISAHAIKIGMLSNPATVEAVADCLMRYKAKPQNRATPIVVDPVLAAKSGDFLLAPEAYQAFIRLIVPLADVLTPNLVEAEQLTGFPIRNEADMQRGALALFALGAHHIVMKGGHLPKHLDCVDILYDGCDFHEYRTRRIETRNRHGTGCTFSSAIAAELAKGVGIGKAVSNAKQYLTQTLYASVTLTFGKGYGPMNHFAYEEQRHSFPHRIQETR